MFIGYYNKSIILTFVGLFCSILGMKFGFDGEYSYAAICMVLSGICDCFDGYVASLVKRTDDEKRYGVELDSLVDAVCFGGFPVVLSFALGYQKIYHVFIYFIYLFAGITRLGYFNIDKENKMYFKGVPITTISFLMPFILFFTVNEFVIMGMFLLISFFFLFHIKINKVSLKGKKIILLLGLFLIGLIFWSVLK